MKKVAGFLVLTFVFGVAAVARGGHALPRKPHWKGNTVKLYDSVTPEWDSALDNAIVKWNAPHLTEVSTDEEPHVDDPATRERCRYIRRAVHICNWQKGASPSWDGIAGRAYYTFSLPDRHFIKARIILNDDATNIAALRDEVMTHEIGHTLGLDHRLQTEATSCMGPEAVDGREFPDSHDYQVVNKLHRNHTHSPTSADASDDAYIDPRDDPQYREVRRGDRVHVTWTLKVPA